MNNPHHIVSGLEVMIFFAIMTVVVFAGMKVVDIAEDLQYRFWLWRRTRK